MPKSHILWDMDGPIFPTEELKAKAHAATISMLGGSIDPVVYKKFMGTSSVNVATELMKIASVDASFETYRAHYKSAYHRLINAGVAVQKGFYELAEALSAREVIHSLVSSSNSNEIKTLLTQANLIHLFQVRISADDVTHCKPDPEPYQKALDCLHTTAEHAVVVEDTDCGVRAATLAGIVVLGVRHAWNENQKLSLAYRILNGYEDLSCTIHIFESARERAQRK